MEFSIPKTHPCFPGHFPGFAVVPGVLVLAQVLHALQVREGRLTDLFATGQISGRCCRSSKRGSSWREPCRAGVSGLLCGHSLASGEIVAGSGA